MRGYHAVTTCPTSNQVLLCRPTTPMRPTLSSSARVACWLSILRCRSVRPSVDCPIITWLARRCKSWCWGDLRQAPGGVGDRGQGRGIRWGGSIRKEGSRRGLKMVAEDTGYVLARLNGSCSRWRWRQDASLPAARRIAHTPHTCARAPATQQVPQNGVALCSDLGSLVQAGRQAGAIDGRLRRGGVRRRRLGLLATPHPVSLVRPRCLWPFETAASGGQLAARAPLRRHSPTPMAGENVSTRTGAELLLYDTASKQCAWLMSRARLLVWMPAANAWLAVLAIILASPFPIGSALHHYYNRVHRGSTPRRQTVCPALQQPWCPSPIAPVAAAARNNISRAAVHSPSAPNRPAAAALS